MSHGKKMQTPSKEPESSSMTAEEEEERLAGLYCDSLDSYI